MHHTVPLSEFVALKRGYDLPANQRRNGNIPILGSFGLTGWHDTARGSGPGVTIGRSGASIGVATYCKGAFWPLNTTLYVTDFMGNDPRYVYYVLDSIDFASYNSGSAQPSLNRNYLAAIPVPCPPIVDQIKIANVLSAYDELIENNSRRIQIHQEMADWIYQEWFVRFRYPGHEGTPLIESDFGRIPKGWQVLTWGDLATLDYGRPLRGYKNAVADYPVFGTNGPIGWHDTPLFPSGVVVGRKGAYRGIHFSDQPCWVIDTAFYLNVHDMSVLDPLFAYHQLRTVDLDSIDSGSAIPSTSRDAFYAIPAIVPPTNLIQRFSEMARAMFGMKRILERLNGALRPTQDLLLPGLISGEIDVSELDLTAGSPAA
jgi:type I restriction enzyme S subunit